MKQASKISFIIATIIIIVVSVITVLQYQPKALNQNKIANLTINEILLGSILVDLNTTISGSPSKSNLPIKDTQTLSVVVDNLEIVNGYITGNFYLVTQNSRLEEINRYHLGDQFVWGLSPGMRNFGLSYYEVPGANEVHVPTYRVKLQILGQDKIWEAYYKVDEGKIFLDENLSNNS